MKQDDIQRISALGAAVSNATIALHEAIAASVGLTGTDHKYLSLLLRNGPATAGELGKLTGLTTGSVTALVDRLEEKGLVKRVLTKADRRKVIIEPDTAAASKLLDPAFKLLQEKIIALVETLSERDRKVVSKYLEDAIAVMDEVRMAIVKDKK